MHKTRKIIFSAFALGGLVLGCTAANNAWADTAKLLEADSNWSVTKIDAKDTKRGEAYCALARRFDENIILTFARNGQNESSVALDLQKQHWNPLREYNVVLMGGYGENRNFDIKPETSGAIVVRLGEDLSFFDALGRSETLEMRVDDQAYKFALSDLLGGQKKLNECLVNLPMTEKVEGAKVQDSVSSGQQGGASEVTKQIENLRQENLRLRNALERERRAYENRFMSESVDSSAVSELSEKARLLEIENGKLHTQLAWLKEDMVSGEASCKAAADDESRKKQDAALAALQKENARLKDSLATQAKRLALLESGTVKDKKDSNENAGVKKDSVKADMDMLKKVRLQEEEINILRDENNVLKNELEQIRQAGEDQRINISSANWNLEKATRRFNEAEREIRRLGGILEDERAKCAREKREIEYMLFDPEIAKKEQTARLVELEKELDKAKTELKRTKDTYKDRIGYLEQELASAQKPRAPAPRKQPATSVKNEPAAVAPNVKPEDVLSAGPTSSDGMSSAARIAREEEMRRINEERMALEEERKELLRRVSRLQQENSRLQAESYRKAPSQTPVRPQLQSQSASSVPAVVNNNPVTLSKENDADTGTSSSAGVRKKVAMQGTADVSRPPRQIQKERVAPPESAAPRPAPQKSIAYISGNDLEDIFRKGGIQTNDGVHRIDVGNDIVAHSWTSGQMFGSSEQSEMDYAGQYDSFVTRYLGKTEGRCPGEFASAASQEKRAGSIRASAYEIACIGDNNAASAAILFFNKDGVFTAIAHETSVDGMDIAMDTRDKLFEILTGNMSLSQRR